MSKFRIYVEETAECEEAYKPDQNLSEGYDCDGFLMLLFREGKPDAAIISNVSCEQVTAALMCRRPSTQIIRAAAIMAEAQNKAFSLLGEVREAVKEDFMADIMEQLDIPGLTEKIRRIRMEEEDD